MESISDIQTIVTCTGLEEFIDKSLALDRIFKSDRWYSKDRKIKWRVFRSNAVSRKWRKRWEQKLMVNTVQTRFRY